MNETITRLIEEATRSLEASLAGDYLTREDLQKKLEWLNITIDSKEQELANLRPAVRISVGPTFFEQLGEVQAIVDEANEVTE